MLQHPTGECCWVSAGELTYPGMSHDLLSGIPPWCLWCVRLLTVMSAASTLNSKWRCCTVENTFNPPRLQQRKSSLHAAHTPLQMVLSHTLTHPHTHTHTHTHTDTQRHTHTHTHRHTLDLAVFVNYLPIHKPGSPV